MSSIMDYYVCVLYYIMRDGLWYGEGVGVESGALVYIPFIA